MSNEIKGEMVEILSEIQAHPDLKTRRREWDVLRFNISPRGVNMDNEEFHEYRNKLVKEIEDSYPDKYPVGITMEIPFKHFTISDEVARAIDRVRFPSLMKLIDRYWNLLSQVPLGDSIDFDTIRETRTYGQDSEYGKFVELEGNNFIISAIRAFGINEKPPENGPIADHLNGLYKLYEEALINL